MAEMMSEDPGHCGRKKARLLRTGSSKTTCKWRWCWRLLELAGGFMAAHEHGQANESQDDAGWCPGVMIGDPRSPQSPPPSPWGSRTNNEQAR
ncbi:hypothetical protein IF1G_01825 [Cordyceps javanica]|uniref:Uncharacterized protein n=1 Tax=Cordyceps javanica TaxID=43265 RepID=A0A545W9P9_9HYPO|nr:hypothetical protein IF1G_01825 [Cordyceps javanica]TQW10714.1 hypothetical protein IF2G_01656 [Cordyceps javanica]